MTAKERILRMSSPAQTADAPRIKPSYTSKARFPLQVKLTLAVARHARSGRAYMIAGPEQEVPQVIIEWMQSDGRYCDKLEDEQPIAATVEDDAESVIGAGGVVHVPDDLTAIKGVGPSGVAKLADAGIVAYGQVAEKEPQVIKDILGHPTGISKAESIIEQAKGLVADAK